MNAPRLKRYRRPIALHPARDLLSNEPLCDRLGPLGRPPVSYDHHHSVLALQAEATIFFLCNNFDIPSRKLRPSSDLPIQEAFIAFLPLSSIMGRNRSQQLLEGCLLKLGTLRLKIRLPPTLRPRGLQYIKRRCFIAKVRMKRVLKRALGMSV